MSTKELKQALLRQKTGAVEKDMIEVIAKALDLEYGMVARVLWSYRYMTHTLGIRPDDAEGSLPIEKSIEDEEVKDALAKVIHDGIQRVVMASAILNGRSVTISPQHLVPKERADELCRGCPEAIDCTAQNYSTPQRCWNGSIASLVVFPLQINGDLVEVEAQQPRGKHVVRLSVINAGFHPA